jgi:hypothetical protein
MKQNYIILAIVTILTMLFIGSELLKMNKNEEVLEGFQASPRITLNFCPRWAPQIQTVKGNTDCCEGDLLDGKCSGKSFCTLSPTHDGVPSCIDAWRQYFIDKSKQCPSSMTNYYEDVKKENAAKGCSSSITVEDGSRPSNSSASSCRIYPTEKENRENKDSCFIEKERLKIQCPFLAGHTNRISVNTYNEGGKEKFGSFVCVYSNPIGELKSCNDEKSLLSFWDRTDPNWRQNNSKYSQLNSISCKTFLERERQRELERQRAEAERRKREEAERRHQEEIRRMREQEAKRIAEEQKKREDAERAMRQFQERNAAIQRSLEEMRRRCR